MQSTFWPQWIYSFVVTGTMFCDVAFYGWFIMVVHEQQSYGTQNSWKQAISQNSWKQTIFCFGKRGLGNLDFLQLIILSFSIFEQLWMVSTAFLCAEFMFFGMLREDFISSIWWTINVMHITSFVYACHGILMNFACGVGPAFFLHLPINEIFLWHQSHLFSLLHIIYFCAHQTHHEVLRSHH